MSITPVPTNVFLPPMAHCDLAFGLQSAKRTAATPSIRLGLDTGGETIKPVFKRDFFQYVGQAEERHYRTQAVYSEGSLDLPLIPTFVDGDLGDWMFGRDATYYDSGYYATIFRRIGTTYERFVDCVVRKGSIDKKQGAPIRAKIDIAALWAPIPGHSDDFASLGPAGVMPLGEGTYYTPYTFDMATFEYAQGSDSPVYGTPGDTLVADMASLDHTLDWDNVCATVEDMITTGAGLGPIALPFAALAKWKINLGRYYAQDPTGAETYANLYADFKNGAEAGYELTLGYPNFTTPTISCVFSLPRCVVEEHPLPLAEKDGFVKSEGIMLHALGSLDGVVAPCTVTEAITSH